MTSAETVKSESRLGLSNVDVSGMERDDLRALLTRMLEIRYFEDEVQRLFTQNLVRGSTHLCQGQEAVAAGACSALRSGDTMTCTYRGHGAILAMGAPLDKTMGEILGKQNGLSGGKGGSMHLFHLKSGALGSFAIVGSHLPFTVGAAFTADYRETAAVSVAFFGDGATNIGTFHEALNLAAIWKLPAIFVCENNLYGEYTPLKSTTPIEHLAQRAASYAMRAERVDGNNVLEVKKVVLDAVNRAREGNGPTFIEALTYRQKGHSRSDPATYRPPGELEDWLTRDPILLFERRLTELGVISQEELRGLHGRAEQRVKEATERALSWEDATPATDLYSPVQPQRNIARDSKVTPRIHREMTYREAVAFALSEEMEQDENVIVLGEDVAGAGGVFKTTVGLLERFGDKRVRDTPISEQAIVGCALGAAVTGLRPVAEIMFADFLGVCYDQIVNQVATYRYLTNGEATVPLTIRLANGAGLGFAAHHSHAAENWLLNIPGLKLCVPGTPGDVYGLLRAAIQDNDPVLVFEHKAMYASRGVVDGEIVPIGVADVVRRGTDVTVVAYQLMRERVLEASDQLEADGISVEVIDPRTLVPLDLDSIVQSVRKTSRLLCVQESPLSGSWGSTVIAQVADVAFESLDTRPRVLTAQDSPIPYAAALEEAWMPTSETIALTVKRILAE